MIDPVSRRALRRSGGHARAALPLGNQRPSISVVVPCYNYGRFLRECVASALDHEGLDIEVVIVDDASTDGSAEVAATIAADDERVSVVRHHVNKKHLATYNDGFAAATGDYLVQLSADDLLPRNSLTRAVALLEAEPAVGFVYGRTVAFADTPPPGTGSVAGWLLWPGQDWVAARCRSGYNVIATTEVVWRRELLDRVGAYRLDLPHSGDLELWLRMAAVSDVGFVRGPAQGFYRLHAENMHNTVFGGGTHEGQFTDLNERWRAFDAFFESDAARTHSGPDALRDVVRHRLAREALDRIGYAYARNFRDFPTGQLEDLAVRLDPNVWHSSSGRALKRRRALGRVPGPLHPLWAPRAVYDRLSGPAMAWRRRRVGV